MDVLAIKDGKHKRFSNEAWKLLGKTKNGWTQVEETNQSVTTEVTNSKATTEKQVVTNEVADKTDTVVVNEVVEETTVVVTEVAPETKEEFLAIVKESVKRASIKDFLDSKEIKYKQNISNDDIAVLLFDTLKGDIEVLKTTFKLS